MSGNPNAFVPTYRLSVFAPKSVDATETTVLTPAAGAAHTNPFLVASSTGITSSTGGTAQPYLGNITGRRGRIDPISKRTDVGELTIPILDVKAGTQSDQLTRWVTAFVGDAFGVSRLIGCKVLIEENLNDGTGWTKFFTGRIHAVRLMDKLQYQIILRDMTADMQVPVFVGNPSPSISGYNVQLPSLLPVGLTKGYGSFPVTSPLTGTIQGTTTRQVGGVSYNMANFVVDSSSLRRTDNIILDEFINALSAEAALLAPDSTNLLGTMAQDVTSYARLRAHLTSSSAGSTGDFVIWGIGGRHGQLLSSYISPAFTLVIGELLRPTSTYAAPIGFLAMPPNGANVTLSSFIDGPRLSGSDFSRTVVIDDVHPLHLWRDMLDGFYGYLWKYGEQIPSGVAVGDPKRKIPYSTAQFSTASAGALINDATFPNLRFIVMQQDRLDTWIEKNILQPCQLGYYLDGSGQVVPVDLRRPTVAPSLTIVDDDVVDGQVFTWEQARDTAITRIVAKYYEDWPAGALDAPVDVANYPIGPSGRPMLQGFFRTVPDTIELLDIGRADANEQALELDAQGFRAIPGETLQGQSRLLYLRQALASFMRNFQQPYGAGAIVINITCRRTANTNTCQPGDTRLITASALPDPRTNKRGGTRVLRCLERSENGPTIKFQFVDLGENLMALPPTLGIVQQSSGDPAHAAQCAVTLNASTEQAVVDYSVTSSTVGAAPGTTDPAWQFADIVTFNRTVTVNRLPAGNRVWIRGRTYPGTVTSLRQPSSYVAASSNGFVDLATLAGPTGLAATVGLMQASLSWTVGDATLRTEVRLAQPSTGVLSRVTTVAPGQNRALVGVLANSSYGADVRHTDGIGGYSTASSVTFATSSGVTNTAPAMRGIFVLMGT